MEGEISMRKNGIALAACLFLLGGLASQAGAQKTTFLLDWIIYGKHAPFFVAKDMGFYKKYGIDVTYKRGFGSGRTIKDIASGVGDIGFADAGSLVNGRANSNLKVTMVAMGHAKTIMIAAFLKKKGYKTPKDMGGAIIGAPIGNAVRVVWPAFAEANKISKVKFIDMGYGSVLPSLLTGKTDVALWFATELPTALPKASERGLEIDYFNYGKWGVNIYNNGVIVRDPDMEKRAKFIKNTVRALMEAFAWSTIHVDDAIKNFLKYAPAMSEPIIREHFAIMLEYLWDDGTRRHGLGYMDHAKMDKTVETLTTLSKLKRRIPTNNLYTNRFLPQWSSIKAKLGDKVR